MVGKWVAHVACIGDDHLRKSTAVMLEACHRACEKRGDGKELPANMLVNAYFSLAAHELVSVQPLLEEDSPVFFFQYVGGEIDEDGIPVIDVKLAKKKPTAGWRKCKGIWKPDVVDELAEKHPDSKESIRKEIESAIASEIQIETDRRVIHELATRPEIEHVTSEDDVISLLLEIESQSIEIHKETMRGPANFMVVDREFAERAGKFGGKNFQITSSEIRRPLTPHRIGTYKNKFAIYEDIFLNRGGNRKLIVGLKGWSFLDAGLIYAPVEFCRWVDEDALQADEAIELVHPGYYRVIEY